MTPSTVTYGETFQDPIVGLPSNAITNKTIFGIKTHLANTVHSIGDNIVNNNTNKHGILCYNSSNNKLVISTEEIASEIFKYLKRSAEFYFHSKYNKNISFIRAVVGIPATYTESQKIATRISARMAGFDDVILRIRMKLCFDYLPLGSSFG